MFGWDAKAGVRKGCAAALLALGLTAGCASDPAAGDSREGDGTAGSMMMSQPSTSGGSGNSSSGGSGPGSSSNAGAMSSGSGNAGSSSSGQSGSGSPSTGNAGAGSGSSMSAAVDCSKLPTPTNADDIVSTFEDGTGNVNQTAGRGGGFYMFNDGSGTQMPAPGGLPDARKMARCDSMFAMCMSGKGFTVWGAGMGTDLGPTGSGDGGVGSKNAYDASMYKGISFWAKANMGSATALRVSMKDANTAPEGGKCDATMDSGAEACNDDWGKALNLTTEWAPYTIMFTDMRQAGWGKATSAFDVMNAYSIQFQVNKGLDFDLCIDDLAFVR